jgi:hypothetical protein
MTMEEMHKLHQDSKAYIAMLEDPARDAYQKPHEVLMALKLKDGERIADIGAGAGYFTLRFAQHVGNGIVYGVDISPDMVLHLNRRVRDAGLDRNPSRPGGKLLADLGAACAKFHDETVRNVRAKRVQCDEIWSFVYAKQKNVPVDMQGQFGVGDVSTWTAIDADSKLIVSWLVGTRDAGAAYDFMTDVAGRLCNRVQLTTDGHKPYLSAVDQTLRVTPAMEAGLTDHVWSIEEIVALLDRA